MLNAKVSINGVEVYFTGDKEDIIYALHNTMASSILSLNEKEIVEKISLESEKSDKKSSLYSKEEMIKMYQYLASQGDFKIQQFEITRGGKTNPVQYTVCLIFDEAKQRYCYYNPKTEDRFLQSYSINDVIAKINTSESGFSLLHTVANRIAEKINVVNDLVKIVSNKTDPFPSDKPVVFKNYTSKQFVNYRQGLVEVLSKTEWMNPKQIWGKMVGLGFTTNGKTPDATLVSLMYVDLKKKGNKSVFEKQSNKALYRLRASVNRPA